MKLYASLEIDDDQLDKNPIFKALLQNLNVTKKEEPDKPELRGSKTKEFHVKVKEYVEKHPDVSYRDAMKRMKKNKSNE